VHDNRIHLISRRDFTARRKISHDDFSVALMSYFEYVDCVPRHKKADPLQRARFATRGENRKFP
jgi:hypothetical protein